MKKVRYVLATLIALFALGFGFYSLNAAYLNRMASSNEIQLSDKFMIHDLNVKLNQGNTKAEYYVKNLQNVGQELESSYQVIDSDGNVYFNSIEKIVLGKNDGKYVFYFSLPKDKESTLMVTVSDGVEQSIATFSLSKSSAITGNVILESPKRLVGSFLFFILFLGILFYIIKLVYRRIEYRKIRSSIHKNGLIDLDLR